MPKGDLVEEVEDIGDGIESSVEADGYCVKSARNENHAISEAQRTKRV